MERASKAQGGSGPGSIVDRLEPVGMVEIFIYRGRPALKLEGLRKLSPGGIPVAKSHYLDFDGCDFIDSIKLKNIIVNQGKDATVRALVSGAIHPVMRMAIGDRGAIPADPQTPKVPVSTMTALYNEVYRADIDAVILDVGTPNVHEAKFIKTFAAADIPLSSYSNQASPVVNEVGLISADPATTPFPRAPVAAPSVPPSDEALFAIRTYRSVPFIAANDITVTIRYTIFIE